MVLQYAITVCDEFEEVHGLLEYLMLGMRKQDSLAILVDNPKCTDELREYLKSLRVRCETLGREIELEFSDEFKGHFANWKNLLTEMCTGDYIFQIDADERLHDYLFKHLPDIIENNQGNEVYRVPRVNTVEGLTEAHMKQWGWRVNEQGHVNFPDYQWRIYANNGVIRWKNRVHEVLDGFKTYADLPPDPTFSLLHPKTIAKQERQNLFYANL